MGGFALDGQARRRDEGNPLSTEKLAGILADRIAVLEERVLALAERITALEESPVKVKALVRHPALADAPIEDIT